MTTLENRPNTALLVIDVQNGVVRGRTTGTPWSPTSTASSSRPARGVPVVWVQHSDEQPRREATSGGSSRS